MLLVKLSYGKFHIFTTAERYKAHSPTEKNIIKPMWQEVWKQLVQWSIKRAEVNSAQCEPGDKRAALMFRQLSGNKNTCSPKMLSQRNFCSPNTHSHSLHTCLHARTASAFKRRYFPEGFASCRSWECSTWTGRVGRGVSWAPSSTSIGR